MRDAILTFVILGVTICIPLSAFLIALFVLIKSF